MKRFVVASGLGLIGWLLIACQSAPPPGDPMQVSWGASVYRQQCARCHEPGRVAPVLTEERLIGYANARKLYEYTQQNMPLDKPGALPKQDYWDVTAYILANDEMLLIPKQKALGPDIADQVNFMPH